MVLMLVFCALALLAFYNNYWKRRNYPPGPTPWPIIGNMLEMKRLDYYSAFGAWKRKYGGVFTMWMGETPVICFADYETITETLVKNADIFSGRYKFGRICSIVRGGDDLGIFEVNDPKVWVEQRKFFLKTFREFGVGRPLMQTKIMQEFDNFINKIEKEQANLGYVNKINLHLDNLVGNLIATILLGQGSPEADYIKFKSIATDHITTMVSPEGYLFAYCPYDFLINTTPLYFVKKRIEYYRDFLMSYFEDIVTQHEEKFRNGEIPSVPSDYIDAFLMEMYKENAGSNYHRAQLLNVLFDTFIAGLETTSSSLGLMLVELLHEPDVVRRVHEELDRVIGSDRPITCSDRAHLPYLCAVIAEGQRAANVGAVNLQHVNLQDVEINGYMIPKGTCIQPMVAVVMWDEKYFPDPHVFKPERFLNEDGTFRNDKHLIPFALGKRQCVGEGFAMMNLFLVIANILQKYNIHKGGANVARRGRIVGLTSIPIDYDIVLEPRH